MDADAWRGAMGQNWAEQWRRTDRSFGQLTDRLLATLRGLGARQVLDIGCGAGELSLAIARSHPRAEVVGVDVSPPLIAVARQRGGHLENARFVCADAAQWQPPEGFSPGLLISRHGVMFFADPPRAFAHLAAIAAPAARLHFSCFRDPALNPFFTEVMRLLPEPAPPAPADAPGPFAFADEQRVRAILETGGWAEVSFEPVDFAMVVGVGADPVAEAVEYFCRIGPAAQAAAQMEDLARARFLERVRAMAQRHCREGIVALPAAAWLVQARRG